MAPLVGQIVFVIEAHRTQQEEIEAGLSMLSSCPRISLLLNKSEQASAHFGSYGYGPIIIPPARAMSCGRTSRRPPRRAARGRDRRPYLSLPLMLFAVAALERTTPAAAQLATGLPPTGNTCRRAGRPPSCRRRPPARSDCPTRWRRLTRCLPGPLPAAAAPPPTPELGLPAPGAGITTLQLYDPNAPAVLIQPYATIGERLTDNVNYTSTNRQPQTPKPRLIPGISVSADTPRFQGVLSGPVEGNIYTPHKQSQPANRQSIRTTEPGPLSPDRAFVDLNSYI